eukprot:SAG31_NODE_27436_length_426_cov_0.743119_1_plen_66_part_00
MHRAVCDMRRMLEDMARVGPMMLVTGAGRGATSTCRTHSGLAAVARRAARIAAGIARRRSMQLQP